MSARNACGWKKREPGAGLFDGAAPAANEARDPARAYLNTLLAARHLGMSLADAHLQAELEAARVRRERQ